MQQKRINSGWIYAIQKKVSVFAWVVCAFAFTGMVKAQTQVQQPLESLQVLQSFLQHTTQGNAVFTQTVTATARDGRLEPADDTARTKKNSIKQSSGTLQFLRPAYLRMEYKKPYAQEIVADGKKLWFFDKDLEQITVREQNQVVVAQTPLAALLMARSLADLQANFEVKRVEDKEKKEGMGGKQDWVWFALTPHAPDGQLRKLELALEQDSSQSTSSNQSNKTPRLRALVSYDGFGQTTTVKLDYANAVVLPAALVAADFVFQKPEGVAIFEQ